MASAMSGNSSQSSQSRPVGDLQLRTNDITEDYDIFDRFTLGCGGNGVVFACKSKTSMKMYALKVILDKPSSRKEINLHWKASGSNCIVRIEEVYENNVLSKPSLLVVMEYMVGGDLYDRMQKNEDRRYTEQQAIAISKQVVEAVTHLHGMNLVHCDLKPQNFLFKTNSLDSPLKLTDFGLAQEVPPEYAFQITGGTEYYMYYAPEVIRGDPYDKSCDMWAIGCTIYYLLSGDFPFDQFKGDDVTPGIKHTMSHGKYNFSSSQWSHISPLAKDLIRQLLKTDPNERMSLEEIRTHPWITGSSASHPTTPNAIADDPSDLSAGVANNNTTATQRLGADQVTPGNEMDSTFKLPCCILT